MSYLIQEKFDIFIMTSLFIRWPSLCVVEAFPWRPHPLCNRVFVQDRSWPWAAAARMRRRMSPKWAGVGGGQQSERSGRAAAHHLAAGVKR